MDSFKDMPVKEYARTCSDCFSGLRTLLVEPVTRNGLPIAEVF